MVVLSYYGQPVGILVVEVVVVVARHCSTSILPVFQQTEGILVEEVGKNTVDDDVDTATSSLRSSLVFHCDFGVRFMIKILIQIQNKQKA